MSQLTILCLAAALQFLIQTLAQQPPPQCPTGCSCTGNNGLDVHCVNLSLTSLPATLDNRTRTLNLSDNLIPALTSQMLANFTQLQNLSLANNRISSVAADAFFNLAAMQRLILSNNSIASISNDTFLGLPALRTLHLDGNALTTFGINVVDDLSGDINIRLDRNPWVCNCSLNETWFRFRNVPIQPLCSSPENLSGRNWTGLQHNELCSVNIPTTTSSSTTPSTSNASSPASVPTAGAATPGVQVPDNGTGSNETAPTTTGSSTTTGTTTTVTTVTEFLDWYRPRITAVMLGVIVLQVLCLFLMFCCMICKSRVSLLDEQYENRRGRQFGQQNYY